MAIIYVRSTDGSNSDDGSTWALAKATLAGALAIANAGDTIYVSDNHAESQASAMTLTSPGTATSPCKILCVDDSAEPPTTLANTATISTTGANNMSFAGFAYIYGIIFSVGSLTSTANINFIDLSAWWFKLERCALRLSGTSASSIIVLNANPTSGLDDQLLELENTTLQFGATEQKILIRSQFFWKNTSQAITGSTFPSLLFQQSSNKMGGRIRIDGVDLSALGSNTLIDASASDWSEYELINCKLGENATISSGNIPGQGGIKITLVNCDSTDTNYRYYKQTYQGTIIQESTIIRSGGASDGTTSISRKMVTTTGSQFFSPLESDPILVWNETTGSSITVSIPVITDNITLTDAEAWIEVEYLGTSGFPLGNFISDRTSDILATPANQATDSSSVWTTTGLTTPVKQLLSVSFTPQEKGLIRVRVMLAKASTTMYFDPLIQIS